MRFTGRLRIKYVRSQYDLMPGIGYRYRIDSPNHPFRAFRLGTLIIGNITL